MKQLLPLLFCLMAAGFAPPGGPGRKPPALVGGSYGRYEIKTILNNALMELEDRQYLYENCGDVVPVARLNEFALVIVATAVEAPLEDPDFRRLEEYVTGGGHLLLIGGAPESLLGSAPKETRDSRLGWTGLGKAQKAAKCSVLIPDHRLLEEVFASP